MTAAFWARTTVAPMARAAMAATTRSMGFLLVKHLFSAQADSSPAKELSACAHPILRHSKPRFSRILGDPGL
jgi:hypothetical protein